MEGIKFLTCFILLDLIELEKLYLDRTALTDVGLEKLTGKRGCFSLHKER